MNLRNLFEVIARRKGLSTVRQEFNFYAGLILGAFASVFIVRLIICPVFGNLTWYVNLAAWICALVICFIPIPTIPIIVYGIVFGSSLGLTSALSLRKTPKEMKGDEK